ncbi:ABC transporter permease [Acidobacteriota bacterium]
MAKSPSPPRLARRLLKRLSRYNRSHSILRDLEDVFLDIANRRGSFCAGIWYWFQCLGAAWKQLLFTSKWSAIMFRNYLKITIRNIKKHKTFSTINIVGLAIGIACCLLIFLWVQDELSYDTFHQNAPSTYRVITNARYTDKLVNNPETPSPFAAGLKQEFPEVVESTRVRFQARRIFKYKEKSFYEDRGILVDPGFFKIFTFPMSQGDPAAAVTDPFTMVLTKSTAEKYFGNEDPMDKTVEYQGRSFIIKGVMEDVPINSHLQFDFVLSPKGLPNMQNYDYDWMSDLVYTYVLLREDADVTAFNHRITDFLKSKHQVWEKIEGRFFLQPLNEIYLNAEFGRENIVHGNSKYIFIFSVIALGLLLIACTNFMNLSTARSAVRTKEIGIRKVVGSNRIQLIKQFLGESFWLALLAGILAVFLVMIALPFFNGLTQKTLTLDLRDGKLLIGIAAIILFTGFMSGSYPAMFLSAFSPVAAFKEKIFSSKKGSTFRTVLVVFQFTLSAFLIVGTLVVNKQLHYMQNKLLGFEKDNIVYLPAKQSVGRNFEALKAELLRESSILAVTAKNGLPTERADGGAVFPKGELPDNLFPYEVAAVDYDFMDIMGLEIVAGRNFSEEYTSDATEACILNERGAQLLGVESPLGTTVSTNKGDRTVIGIVRDAYFKSLHRKIDPIIFYVRNPLYNYTKYGVILIKIKGGDIPRVLGQIESTWKKINPGIPFEFSFLDEAYDRLYQSEQRLSTSFSLFSALAIFISCIGLLGLASFMAERRTKEIGIRKVMGASFFELVVLMGHQFTKWIIGANLIAWPLAYLAMKQWLFNFAYRTEIPLWIFPLTGLLTLLIALLMVSFQAIRAAMAHPVNVLRYE